MLREDLVIGTGPVIETLEPRLRGQSREVLVAGVVGRQQREVAGALRVDFLMGLFVPIALVEVGLDTEDRLDACVPAPRVELDGPVHDAVVGDGAGGHPGGGGRGEHLPDPAGAVEHRILGMGMQMDEAQTDPRTTGITRM